MGPFPHSAPRADISERNPAGTDGFEFVEFAHPEPEKLESLFRQMGYAPVARHRSKAITVWRQGDINYLVTAEPGTHGTAFVEEHGPSAPSMAWRVVDAKHAFEPAGKNGAAPYVGGGKVMDVPAIVGIGGSLLYFVDRYGDNGSAYDEEFACSANGTRARKASASINSITSHTMSIAATWTNGGISTAISSASPRSTSSISRANIPGFSAAP